MGIIFHNVFIAVHDATAYHIFGSDLNMALRKLLKILVSFNLFQILIFQIFSSRDNHFGEIL